VTPEQYAKAQKALASPDFPETMKPRLREMVHEYEQKAPKNTQSPEERAAALQFGSRELLPNAELGLPEGPGLPPVPEAVIRAVRRKRSPVLTGKTEGMLPSEAIEAEQRAEAETYDKSLPSASGRKDRFAPPSFVPEGAGPLSRLPFPIAGGAVSSGTNYYIEPPIREFQREMAPVYGDKVRSMDAHSREYQEYADSKWKEAYDAAVAEKRPIVRTAYAKPEDTGGKVALGAAKAGQVAQAFLGPVSRLGFQDPGTEGPPRVEEAHPIASGAGEVASMISPIGPEALLGQGVRRVGQAVPLLSKVAAAAPKTSRFAGAAIEGGVAGAGGQAARAAVGGEDIAEAAERGAGLGAGAGALLGGILSPALAAEGRNLRRTSPLGVTRPPKEQIQALENQAQGMERGPHWKPDVSGMLGDVEKGTPVSDQAIKIRRGLVDKAGKPTPGNEERVAKLDEIIRSSANVERSPHDVDRAAPEGIEAIRRADEARMRDLDLLREGQRPMEDVVRRESEATAAGGRSLRQAAGGESFAHEPTTPIEPTRLSGQGETELMRDLRAAPPRVRAGERLGTLHEERMTHPNVQDVSPDEAARMGLPLGAIQNEADSLRYYPSEMAPGEAHRLRLGYEAQKELERQRRLRLLLPFFSPGILGPGEGAVRAGRLYLDPMLQQIGPRLRAYRGAAAGYRPDEQTLPEQLDPATLEAIERGLGR
jgi:hypothetical protein